MSDPEVFKSLGPAGAFIGMMATAIATLAAANGLQWRNANKVYGYRLTERDTLRDALNDSSRAIEAQNRASEERNRATKELADAMRQLSGSFDKLTERLAMQYEHGKDRAAEQSRRVDNIIETIGSLADALRNNTAIATEVRNGLDKAGII